MNRAEASAECEAIEHLIRLKKKYEISTTRLIKRDLTKCNNGLIL